MVQVVQVSQCQERFCPPARHSNPMCSPKTGFLRPTIVKAEAGYTPSRVQFPLNPCYLSSLPEALKTQLKETQRAAFTEGTYSNLLIQWRVFLSFCEQYQYLMVPAATETICLFAQFLANRFKSPGSVRNLSMECEFCTCWVTNLWRPSTPLS